MEHAFSWLEALVRVSVVIGFALVAIVLTLAIMTDFFDRK